MTTYDVIVVGAGSAGAVLAAELSRDPNRSVLLLEAGADNSSGGAPPALHSPNFFNAVMEPGRTWPNLMATRAPGQSEALYLRGRGAGGSSSVNAMVAIRGSVDDYDRWPREYGCVGWGWAEMLEAFLAVEDDADFGGDGLHGKGGPLPIARVPRERLSPLDQAVRSASIDLGYGDCDDYHALVGTGFSPVALTFRDGQRVSTNDAYLEPARQRPNLEVRGDALVDRVLLDGRRAVGVRTAAGEEVTGREVVVSAGTIHSPAILLRSGIGPESGLAVGANLTEHAATAGFEVTLNPAGRMPSANATVFNSILRYSSDFADAGPNDVHVAVFGATGPDEESLGNGRLIGAVMRVFSRGEVRLRSTNPTDDPVVDFQMLSDERDRIRLRDCVQRMIEVVRHPAVDAISSRVHALDTAIDALTTADAIDSWLTAHVSDYVHSVGTCRMGSPGDEAAVVDPSCRVMGFENLRVCDASVMPDVPKANTHLTTVAIAQRLASRWDA